MLVNVDFAARMLEKDGPVVNRLNIAEFSHFAGEYLLKSLHRAPCREPDEEPDIGFNNKATSDLNHARAGVDARSSSASALPQQLNRAKRCLSLDIGRVHRQTSRACEWARLADNASEGVQPEVLGIDQ